jgi:dTDP-4-amino-4,6-dideoxygalactose transaminase
MTNAPFLPQANPGASYDAQREAIDAAIRRVLTKGRYILGDEVAAFESEFAAYLGVEEAVGVASGTDALELALRACEIGAGQAVIAPSHTAVATIAAIERAGARPVLIDVDPARYTIDAATIEAALHSGGSFGGCRPAAIIAVHLYGNPAEMIPILDVAARHGLQVIEDCAQSHGARLDDLRTGTFGDLAAFSFYPTKNLGAIGDGGAVVTNDRQLAERVRALREYGWVQRSVSAYPGVNSRLDELQAAILRTKLPRLDDDNERRREIAKRYAAGLNRTEFRLPTCAANVEPVFHQFVIRVANKRDAIRKFLERNKIGTAIHYPVPVHRQPAYADRGLQVGPLEQTDKLCAEIVSLPIYPQMTNGDVDRVVAATHDWLETRSATRGPST